MVDCCQSGAYGRVEGRVERCCRAHMLRTCCTCCCAVLMPRLLYTCPNDYGWEFMQTYTIAEAVAAGDAPQRIFCNWG